mmetsp:Transcript_12718/g.44551  ORF Transcript_12718/g.44551 Transcript_12718/m.44551 type:complete len:92 (+) Transcript_12718:216-491(+)
MRDGMRALERVGELGDALPCTTEGVPAGVIAAAARDAAGGLDASKAREQVVGRARETSLLPLHSASESTRRHLACRAAAVAAHGTVGGWSP